MASLNSSASASPHRDAIAAALLAYCKLLTQLPHLPEDAIAVPPTPDGWPEEDRAKFGRLGKSQTVVDLLCHIPYITTRDFEVNYETLPIDWRSEHVYRHLERHGSLKPSLLEPVGQVLPSNVVSLTQGFNYGRYVLLDVDTGLAIDYSPLGGPNPEVSDDEISAGLIWTKLEKRPLVEMLADWSEKLRSLCWVAVPNRMGHVAKIRTPVNPDDPDQEEARQIYRDHGWGTGKFRKEQCREAMMAWDAAAVRG